MKVLKRVALPILGIVILLSVAAQASHIPTVGLGTAQSFAVLAGQGVTNTGGSTVRGDLGSHPNAAVTGFPPGNVTDGTINPSYTANAKADLVTAYNSAAGRTPVTTIATELGGQTLLHGIYDSASGTFGITGTLTLNAQNDPNAVWIFKTASTLITGSSSNVNIINSPNPAAATCRIFWQVGSSATLGSGSTLRGTIMALASISLNTSATLIGRALAREGSVTMNSNTIDASACLQQVQPSPSPGTSPSPSPGTSPSPSPGVSPSPGTSPSPGVAQSPGTSLSPSVGSSPTPVSLPAAGISPSPSASGQTATAVGLAVTGLPQGPAVVLGVAMILIGLYYNLLGSSWGPATRIIGGYVPKHRASRRR